MKELIALLHCCREMAGESDIINSLIWDKSEKNLAKFLKQYELPLIVRVVKGFYSNNEDACIYDEQILALHKTHSTPKLLGTDVSGSQVSIPLSCPIPVLIYPAKCKYPSCKVEDFKSLFPKLQYVRVRSCGSEASDAQEASESSLKIGDFLQIKTIDTKNKNVLCQNVHTKENLSLPYACPAFFTPMLHYRQYTLSEAVFTFNLPIKVSFEVTQTVQDSYEWNNALSGLSEVVLHKEVMERNIIATTVGTRRGGAKCCLGLPPDLPIRCTVPEPLTKCGGTFVDVTRWLRSLSVGFEDIQERINVVKDKNIVKIYDFISSDSSTTQPEVAPGLVRTPARRLHAPQVSPRKKTPETPNDSKQPLQDPSINRSRSENEVNTSTNEERTELFRSQSESSATMADIYEDLSRGPVTEVSPTIAEDEYVDMASLKENTYENPDILIDKKSNTLTRSYLPEANASALPDSAINQSSKKPTPLKKPVKKVIKSIINPSQGYEEVEAKWNKQGTRNFAVPSCSPSAIRKELLPEIESEYVIPITSANAPPKKFEICKRPETKNQTSSGYENVDLNSERNKQKDAQSKSAYENVFFKIESDSKKFENVEEYEAIKPRNIQTLKSKFEKQALANTEVK